MQWVSGRRWTWCTKCPLGFSWPRQHPSGQATGRCRSSTRQTTSIPPQWWPWSCNDASMNQKTGVQALVSIEEPGGALHSTCLSRWASSRTSRLTQRTTCNFPEVFPERAVSQPDMERATEDSEQLHKVKLQAGRGGGDVEGHRWQVCGWPRGLGSCFHRRVAGALSLKGHFISEDVLKQIKPSHMNILFEVYPKERLWQTQRWTQVFMAWLLSAPRR